MNVDNRGMEGVSSSLVFVHVYDIFKFNSYIDRLGFGVYHTGVQVYDTEYCYGGHPQDHSGIFAMEPKDIESLGDDYTFKTSVFIGSTDFTEADVRQIISNLDKDFCGNQYHLLKKNCNHFSSAFIQILCGQTLPKWVNRLAETSCQIPFIEKIIPREWLKPQEYMDSSVEGPGVSRPVQFRRECSQSTTKNGSMVVGASSRGTTSRNNGGSSRSRPGPGGSTRSRPKDRE